MRIISSLGSRNMKAALGLALLALLALLVLVAEAATEKVQVTATKKVTVDLDADVTVFEGNVRIAYGDVEIMAERAEVKERKIAHLSGNVKLIQPDIVLTGEVFTAYINEKRVIAERDVILTKEETKADEASDSSLAKDTVVIMCDKMDLSTKTRGFTAEGNVRVRRGSSFAKADQATYAESEKVVVLRGNVSAEGKNGESIKCGKLIFRTDKDYMEAETEVVFEFEIDEDTNDQKEE